MTMLAILSDADKNIFNSPAKLTNSERIACFTLDKKLLKIIEQLRTSTNKIGFLLQFGYFKANRKFYVSSKFRQKDIIYVANILNIDPIKFNMDKYRKKIPGDHRVKILKYFNWKQLNEKELKNIEISVSTHVKHQFSPRKLFDLAIDYCWNNQIEIPSYHQLTSIITSVYHEHEQILISIVKKYIDSELKQQLNLLVKDSSSDDKYQRPMITVLKQTNQSLRPSQIKENTNLFIKIQEYFQKIEPLIDKLDLTDQATEYFATWVQKAETSQLSKFKNKHKLYLYLISFIKHQYYYRSDTLINIFIKSTQSAKNHANKLFLEHDKSNKSSRNRAIKKISKSFDESYELISSLNRLVFNQPELTIEEKFNKIELLLKDFNSINSESSMKNLSELGCNLSTDNNNYYDTLESLSIKLQRRVASIVKLVDFNEKTSDNKIIKAIIYFKNNDGEIGIDAPLVFLNNDEKDIVSTDNKIRVSLYKILLFLCMEDALKSGKLTLKYSYDYKSFDEYLINEDYWKNDHKQFLKGSGLSDYIDCDNVLLNLEEKLNEKYDTINKNILNKNNKYLFIDENKNIKITTPKINNNKNEYISSLLINAGYVPILQILSDIESITNFTNYFKHHSVKSNKMSPSVQVIFAGILGKGCNIGINKIANISVGIAEGILRNTVRWCFSLKNIQLANNKIITMINKLSLANAFKLKNNLIHTSSDGSKLNVAVDSLNANYSFKYFGKGKGSTMYTFLDERNALFHSTVISSSEREAAYVIDGLLQNDVIQSNLHSTDTHGFTESIFAATHFIGTAFAPRFKQISKQYLYSFSTKSSYKKNGYQILPSRKINIKLIKSQWDNILRFMATIKLRHSSASILFKRLSSYAKDHPLYKALKEFGRIIKSIFILTYYDDLKLRQSIEKQLNKVELSHKFSKAIFFSNNQEFQFGEKHDQEINIACMSLIQNCIVLWNYLYLSQLLINNGGSRQQMLNSIKLGSAICWQHINLHGEYNFNKSITNDNSFDMEKILKLNVS